ncbi:sensor histidine kinase [Larkinella sp. VNQ87]|uniref:sensor histidine kinase n=1 Tax=Larkinella sp. VNQ87 TaxID=3400921 RepID=UPI003C121D83
MKEWLRINRYDVLVMLVNYPALFVGNYLVLGQAYFNNFPTFLPLTLAQTGLFFLFALIMDVWTKYMHHRYGGLDQAVRRLTFCLVFYIVVTFVFVCLLYGLYDWLEAPGYRFSATVFGWTALIGFITNIVSVGLLESVHSYHQWKESVEREYGLKQLNMQRQLDSLKQQVNPHFLFNSLNSLTALIGENPQQAETFAEELSSVYRYLLRSNETILTTLSSELDFIQSYFHLLKTRHGAALSLVIKIFPGTEQMKLPPLTLQLLVENAVKHNVTLAEQPLQIEIETDERGALTVRNTLQKKKLRVLSNGVGLSNILAKYQMLGQPSPSVQETGDQFVVTLSLIEADAVLAATPLG